MHNGRCVVCGARRTNESMQRFAELVDRAVGAVLSTGQAPAIEPTECCPVPDYISLRAFATAYYGKLWYASPNKVWTYKASLDHNAEVAFTVDLYHLYRFSNYTSLEQFFTHYDTGELTVIKITDEVLPGFTKAAVMQGGSDGSTMPAQPNSAS